MRPRAAHTDQVKCREDTHIGQKNINLKCYHCILNSTKEYNTFPAWNSMSPGPVVLQNSNRPKD